jgi:preprotein translocase subunit SecD
MHGLSNKQYRALSNDERLAYDIAQEDAFRSERAEREKSNDRLHERIEALEAIVAELQAHREREAGNALRLASPGMHGEAAARRLLGSDRKMELDQ